MAPPWIIWTRQRTAGIALSNALSAAQGGRPAESEPFDGSVEVRRFSYVPRLGRRRRGEALRAICQEGWCIKHCYDLLPLEFNLELAQATNKAGYRHVHLIRRNELARLISLGIAENEVTWLAKSDTTRQAFEEIQSGKRKMKSLDVASLVERSRLADYIWSEIAPHLARCKIVWTEELVSPSMAQRRTILAELLGHLGMRWPAMAIVEDKLKGSGQDTFSLWQHVPNIDELRRALVS